MKVFKVVTAIALLAGLLTFPSFGWAATANATVNVSAVVPVIAILTLDRDVEGGTSVTRGSAVQVLFDKRDDEDIAAAAPRDAGVMYAPYRSEVQKNWHILRITANGSTMSLAASVTGTVGTTPLANILKVWCGGFFLPNAATPIAGTATVDDGNIKTDDWEVLNGFRRSLNRAFSGVASFNYRLDIGNVQAGTISSGGITFSLTTT